MPPARGVYPMTDSLRRELRHAFSPLERQLFLRWRQAATLVRAVEGAARGDVCKFVAESAIRQHNQKNGTHYTFEEVLGRSIGHHVEWWPEAEWVVYCWADDQEHLIFNPDLDRHEREGERVDDIIAALTCAPSHVQWAILYETSDETVRVYRSPYVEPRELVVDDGYLLVDEEDVPYAYGLRRGYESTYVLAPEMEGSCRQDLGEFHGSPRRVHAP